MFKFESLWSFTETKSSQDVHHHKQSLQVRHLLQSLPLCPLHRQPKHFSLCSFRKSILSQCFIPCSLWQSSSLWNCEEQTHATYVFFFYWILELLQGSTWTFSNCRGEAATIDLADPWVRIGPATTWRTPCHVLYVPKQWISTYFNVAFDE